ncbi:PadR family transcriptional regulator [Lysinibacillus contaminans]|uniref:PadR family transcriptional regulator n=1 Tax=Lysinibacillus contaminans TaxID=1293441 RepID=A0ABR5K3J9_9BACI|nr:DinB family protein [Lysinibacillus contaminans]KOS68924.1 PadR family transcriptional regulator [Lysinibacillus contaminans]
MNPFIYDQLYNARNNLMKEITLLSDAQFNSKPDLNMWSIAQVCHHLVLVEEASLKAIAWGILKSDLAQQERKEIPLLLLDRTKKLKAPRIVEPAVEPFEVNQIIDLLNDSRKKLLAFLSTIEDKSILAKKSVHHPALGELPLDQWLEQIYLHEHRHTEQIKEIKLFLDMGH